MDLGRSLGENVARIAERLQSLQANIKLQPVDVHWCCVSDESDDSVPDSAPATDCGGAVARVERSAKPGNRVAVFISRSRISLTLNQGCICLHRLVAFIDFGQGIWSYFAVCMSKFWPDVVYLPPSGEPFKVYWSYSLMEFPPLTSAPHLAGLFLRPFQRVKVIFRPGRLPDGSTKHPGDALTDSEKDHNPVKQTRNVSWNNPPGETASLPSGGCIKRRC